MALSLAVMPTAFVAPSSALTSAGARVKMVATSKPLGSDEFCYGLPGAIEPLGPFDPLGFTEGADVLEVNRLREAELVHGRVGMLAAAGFLVQEKFHPLFESDRGPAIDQIANIESTTGAGFLVALTMCIGFTESLRINKGWAYPSEDTLKDARAGGKSQSFQRLKPDYTPGDLGFDPLNLKPEDPAEFRIMQEKELSHGRLGMIAAAGFLAQEAVSGTTWGTWWGLHPQLDGGLIDASF
jgi:hypothetical protein